LGGFASRNSQRMWLVLIFSLACTLMDSAAFDCACNYDGWCHLSPDEEQCIWNAEAFHFIYGHQWYGDYFEPWNYGYPYYGPASYGPAYYNAAGNNLARSNGSIVDNYANYWLENADELYIAGSYDQAAASYARAVQLNPFLLEGWINMGNALYFLGKYEDSLSAYDAALGLEPQNANALMGRNQALAALNSTKQDGVVAYPQGQGAAAISSGRKITELGSWGSTTTPTVEPIIVGTHPQI